MNKETSAEVMRRISREHLEKNGGLLLGQCLSAVGWVGGTVPEMREEEGIVENSMADVAGGAIAVGLALAGRRPIFVVRYQGFQWYNLPSIVNYAAKSKELWGIPCPMFVRSIAMEGAIGPVAGGSHHSLATYMPGIVVSAPVTPKEYQHVWDKFMQDDNPYYVSEHRRSFALKEEIPDVINNKADITLIPISSTRLNTIEVLPMLLNDGIRANVIQPIWLKPFNYNTPEQIERLYDSLRESKLGLVIDGSHEDGFPKCLAYDLMQKSGRPVHVLGLEERTAGFAPHLDNVAPTSKRIYDKIKKILS